MERIRTVTVRRPEQDITVEVTLGALGLCAIGGAIDEDGNAVQLTGDEWVEVFNLAREGHDETGR